MKLNLRAAALAVGGLLCFSATEAFAGGLNFLGTQSGGSWFANYQIDTSAFGLSGRFNRIDVQIVNNEDMTFTNAQGGSVTFLAAGNDATTSVFKTDGVAGDKGADLAYRFADGNTATSGGFADFTGSAAAAGYGETAYQNTAGARGGEDTQYTTATAAGALTNILNFSLHLDRPPVGAPNGAVENQTGGMNTDGVRYRIQLYNGNQLVAVGQAYFKQVSTGPNGVQNAFQELQIVPLPPAVWAGLATLGAMGAFLAQRRRSRQLLV